VSLMTWVSGDRLGPSRTFLSGLDVSEDASSWFYYVEYHCLSMTSDGISVPDCLVPPPTPLDLAPCHSLEALGGQGRIAELLLSPGLHESSYESGRPTPLTPAAFPSSVVSSFLLALELQGEHVTDSSALSTLNPARGSTNTHGVYTTSSTHILCTEILLTDLNTYRSTYRESPLSIRLPKSHLSAYDSPVHSVSEILLTDLNMYRSTLKKVTSQHNSPEHVTESHLSAYDSPVHSVSEILLIDLNIYGITSLRGQISAHKTRHGQHQHPRRSRPQLFGHPVPKIVLTDHNICGRHVLRGQVSAHKTRHGAAPAPTAFTPLTLRTSCA
ncbi:hypothetical protein J6590_047747, partial [Homalodisca vitripennis]